MKKLLIALLALGTLSFVPSADARCGKKACAPKCEPKPHCEKKCHAELNAPTKACDVQVSESTEIRPAGFRYETVKVPMEQDVIIKHKRTITDETHEERGECRPTCAPACVPSGSHQEE